MLAVHIVFTQFRGFDGCYIVLKQARAPCLTFSTLDLTFEICVPAAETLYAR